MKQIVYIKRKPDSKYHSIEGVFQNIENSINKYFTTETVPVLHSGASPLVILKNCINFKKVKDTTYHITGDVHYIALVTGKRTILTIHDIGSAITGSFLKRFYIQVFWFWLPALFVKRITVISHFTKEELSKIIPFAKNKITVVHNPVNQLFKNKAYTFNVDCPTILCVGTKPNKNLKRIFESVKGLKCSLHLVGQLTGQQLKILKEYKIEYINSIKLSRTDIVKAYIDSDFLCFPSTYEGFGMPIIEAQAIGRPVLTSNLGAMKEVAGESTCLVDPFKVDSIRNGINKIISNNSYRDALIKKGFENIKRFTIDTIAQDYINLYKEIESR